MVIAHVSMDPNVFGTMRRTPSLASTNIGAIAARLSIFRPMRGSSVNMRPPVRVNMESSRVPIRFAPMVEHVSGKFKTENPMRVANALQILQEPTVNTESMTSLRKN
mmetsp:Transcript_10865/g.13072  ORF Transcript_10865/g.13072 Transcript_10865/m.13072 type:complete len:107 (+) Transcript_10865:237-557(+)